MRDSLKRIQHGPLVAPFLVVGQPDSDTVCGGILDAQKNDVVVADRIPQSLPHGGRIQHRVTSRQHAGALAFEVTDEVPQCAPGANVSPAVRELVEAVDRQLNRTATDEWLQLLLEEACAQARKGACDPVVE